MNRYQEMLSYYCGQLHSEWAQKKALAYLRILTEAEGNEARTETKAQNASFTKSDPCVPHSSHRGEYRSLV